MRRRRRLGRWWLLALAAGCQLAKGAGAGEDHVVEVSLDDTLGRLSVTVCPAAGGARHLEARDTRAGEYLLAPRVAGERTPLAAVQGRITLPADAACVTYAVDLRGAMRANARYRGIGTDSVALSAAQWLWRPVGAGGHATVVRFLNRERWRVSVPWTPLDAGERGVTAFLIPPSPESDDAVTVFGRFDQCEVVVPGARLRAAVLEGRYPGNPSVLLEWLRAAATNVALTYGRFPNPAPQVVVVPTAKRHGDPGEPVPFGHVIRDGGEAVQFFVNQQRRLDALLADWTATHEFAHLLIPYIDGDEKWISEGLASYYQNVLMARAGTYTPEKAWRKIVEGFGRGENSVPHLSLENAMPVGSWDGIMKTYWGGAAVFMLADLELRALSGNVHSLDTVLDGLQACCLPSTRTWSGRRLFRKLDRLSPHAVFERLYEENRASAAFPSYREALARLGIDMNFGRVRFNAGAPLVHVREAIMARRAVPGVEAGAPRCTVTTGADFG